MTANFEPSPEFAEKPDYTIKLAEMLENEFSHIHLPKRSFDAIVAGLTISQENNGGVPGDKNYKEFHNDSHPFESIKYGFKLLDLLKEAGVDIQIEHYEIVGIALGFHDAILQIDDVTSRDNEGKSVEILSADLALQYMPLKNDENDPVGFGEQEREYVYSAVEVTEGEHKDNGDFIRTKLHQPGRHFTAWVVAMADTGNPLFGNPEELIETATNLGSESKDSKSTDVTLARDAYMKILGGETVFVGRIISDIREGIPLYFPERAEKVGEMFDKTFTGQLESILKIANVIDQNLSEFRNAIEHKLTESKDGVIHRTEKINAAVIRVLKRLLPS